MQLTLTDAAKLYRKQRKTLYRHIDAGRLSCSVRGDGRRVIDLSELIRCYGEPPQAVPADDTPATRPGPEGDTLTRGLLSELVQINREQARRLESLEHEVAMMREELRRLPAPASAQNAPQELRQADTLPDATHAELRSLVDALRGQE